MTQSGVNLGVVIIALAASTAEAASSIGEQTVISVRTRTSVDAITTRPTFYPGEGVTLSVSGQIDGNHQQWEEDECHSIDIFKMFCKKVRRHASHLRPHTQVGPLIQAVSPSGGLWTEGIPSAPTSSAFTAAQMQYFQPGGSGTRWSYTVDAAGSATFKLNASVSSPSGLLSPLQLRAFVGDLIAGVGPLVYDDCGPLRTCSEGAFVITLSDVDVTERLKLITDFLADQRDLTAVTSDSLIDEWVKQKKPNDAAKLLLRHADRFYRLAGSNTSQARRQILDLALSVATREDPIRDILERELALFHVEAGNLSLAIGIVSENLPDARIAWNRAIQTNPSLKERREKGLSYAGWLTAAARAYAKQTENIDAKDVRSGIAMLRSANEVLADLIQHAPRGRDLELESDYAHNGVTTARLLTLMHSSADLEDAAQAIDRARGYFPRAFDGLITSNAGNNYVLLRSPTRTNPENAISLDEHPLEIWGWQIVPNSTSRDIGFAAKDQKLMELKLGSEKTDLYLLKTPVGAGKLRVLAARPRAIIVGNDRGAVWRLSDGTEPVTLLKDAASDRRIFASPLANVALSLGTDGTFIVASDLDEATETTKVRTGQSDILKDVSLATVGQLDGSLARLAWIGAGKRLEIADVISDGDASAKVGEQIPCSGAVPSDLETISMVPVQGNAKSHAILLIGKTGAARGVHDGTKCIIEPLSIPEGSAFGRNSTPRVWFRDDGWILFPEGRSVRQAAAVLSAGDAKDAIQMVVFPRAVSLDSAQIRESLIPSLSWTVYTNAFEPDSFQIGEVRDDPGVRWTPFELRSEQTKLRIIPGSAKILSDGNTVVALDGLTSSVIFHHLERSSTSGQLVKNQRVPIQSAPETVTMRLVELGSSNMLVAVGISAEGTVTEATKISRQTGGDWRPQRVALPLPRIIGRGESPPFTVHGWVMADVATTSPRFLTLIPQALAPATWVPPKDLSEWKNAQKYAVDLFRIAPTTSDVVVLTVADPLGVVGLLEPVVGSRFGLVRTPTEYGTVSSGNAAVNVLVKTDAASQNVEVFRSADDKRVAFLARNRNQVSATPPKVEPFVFQQNSGYRVLQCAACSIKAAPEQIKSAKTTPTLNFVGIQTERCIQIIQLAGNANSNKSLEVPGGDIAALTEVARANVAVPLIWVSAADHTEVYDEKHAKSFNYRCE